MPQADLNRTQAASARTLTLAHLLEVARTHNPSYAVFQANRQAAQAQVTIGRQHPNPEASGSFGVAQSREGRSLSKGEFGLEFSQPLELPWKRSARIRAASSLENIVSAQEAEFTSLLRAEVTEAALQVVYHEQALAQARNADLLVQDVLKIVEKRVGLGDVPEVDRIKAQVKALRSAQAVRDAQGGVRTSWLVLDALCGRTLPPGSMLEDILANSPEIADLNLLLSRTLESHPRLRRLEAERTQKALEISKERAAASPDLTVGGYVHREFDTDGQGLSLGVAIPLWNRNQGAIAAAKAESRRVEAEISVARAEIARDVALAIERYRQAWERLQTYSPAARENARKAVEMERLLYTEGETGLLQLLDAQRVAQEVERTALEAALAAHLARLELGRAAGWEMP